MKRLGIRPEKIPYVFISHEHWDHVGGIPELLQHNRKARFFLPRASTLEPVSLPGHSFRRLNKPEMVRPGFFSTGSLGNEIPEQSLVVHSPLGLVLITGCAHPGIAHIAQEVRKQFPQEPFALAMGGFHLKGESEAAIRKLIEKLRSLGILYMAPSHCTGSLARNLFQQQWREKFFAVGVGSVLVIDRSGIRL